MAKGPKGEKRPADLNRRAFDIVQIATGEIDETKPRGTAVESGSKGGAARAAKMPADERRKAAKAAAQARWRKKAEV